jgi:hypothetical protein
MRRFIFLLSAVLGGCPLIGNQPLDLDGDGFNETVDCNDNDPTIHPDQEEPCICDNIDQNCNGEPQDFLCDIACPPIEDLDGDGFDSTVDCNDNDATIHPDQEEPCACDSIDHNCNGSITDLPCDIACNDADGDGFSVIDDCNDNDATIHPDQPEPCTCDNIDHNCNGSTTDLLNCVIQCDDNDGDGFDSLTDCNDFDSDIHPDAGEPCICDSVDQNCNGDPQDFDCEIACGDADGDGFNSDIDCNDNDPLIHPNQEEPCTCDAIDQNCNGIIDDFPCDIACNYLQESDVCSQNGTSTGVCEPGLLCCYPCGIEGCDDVCMQPANNAECPLFP